ncbi:SAP domain-containing ribonucleoprotein [Atheta coriaria]|uniref:SAP domain-containing ribonucleoprotein n=1 Tax=Dalotia coriaria TaxID=877792 RepID=UPI0031F436A3
MDTSLTVDMDLSKLKVPELRKELKNRGLSTAGNKNDLLERLQSANKNEKANDAVETADDAVETASGDELDEDLLNEDDDESHIEDSYSALQDLDATIEESPPAAEKPAQGTKRKSDEGTTNDSAVKKANVIITNDTDWTKSVITGRTKKEKPEKKVIKLTDLTVQERVAMRTKKFAGGVSEYAKKAVRAERFGIDTTTKPAVGGKIKTAPISAATAASADVLKRRAERFGIKVSTTLTKLENQEKLEKRKARFGITSPVKTAENGAAKKKNTLSTQAQDRLKSIKKIVM